jgi:hypothetical protein
MYRYHYYKNLAKTNNTILHGGKPCIPPCLGGISGSEIHPATPNQSNVSVVRGAQNTAPDIMGHPNPMPPTHQILPQPPLRLELAVGPSSGASSQGSRSTFATFFKLSVSSFMTGLSRDFRALRSFGILRFAIAFDFMGVVSSKSDSSSSLFICTGILIYL